MEQERCLREKDGLTHVQEGGRGMAGTYQDGGWLQGVEAEEKKIGAEIERGENNKRK